MFSPLFVTLKRSGTTFSTFTGRHRNRFRPKLIFVVKAGAKGIESRKKLARHSHTELQKGHFKKNRRGTDDITVTERGLFNANHDVFVRVLLFEFSRCAIGVSPGFVNLVRRRAFYDSPPTNWVGAMR